MDFVSPIITPIVQSLMVPIKKHLGFLVSSTKYVKKMEAKMKQLKDTAQEVQARMDMAIENIEVVPERVEPWLEDVKKLDDERSNLIEAVGCFNMAKRYKVGKQSYDMLEEIKDLENRESKIVFAHAQRPLAEVGSTSTFALVPLNTQNTSSSVCVDTQNNFESRVKIFNDALEALQSTDESKKMIALCGMGGVGKTTMMEQLKKAVEGLKMFDWVVKVVIGENNDVISLQQAIARYIGNDLTETTKDARADRLGKIFEAKSQQGQKKILVIMDDLWNDVSLSDVGLSPLPHGFKLLFTSRFEYVCTNLGVRTIFKIGVLSKTEANTLFFRTVGQSPLNDDAEIQRMGEDIVVKCGGLPIAIVTIAKSLSGNIKEAWQKALWRLEKDDLKDLGRITHSIFEMSYENLKEDDDKAIFLLCGLFPDDFDIRIEDLLRYGWGLKFFNDVQTIAIARSHMKICVNNLIRANLLTESGVDGCVKMHDLVRAFVLNSFSKVKQASIVNHANTSRQRFTKDANESYERILLKCPGMLEFPANFSYPNISLLILMDMYQFCKFPSDMYKRMEKLEVLSYENMGIPLLPRTFEHSTKLQTLCLHSCSLFDDISFLGSLGNLEILSLVHCSIRRLPSTIGKLKNLRLLDLTGCMNLLIEDGVIQNLSNLEELYMRASKGSHVRFTRANFDELEKLSQRLFALELELFAWTPRQHSVSMQIEPRLKNMSFKNLKRFNLSIGCELEIERFRNYSFKNKLNIVATCNELHECNVIDLFEKTEELKLQVNDMYNLTDVSMNHKFSQLRVFHVSKCANLTCLFTAVVANGLKKLERLVIKECHVLKTLVSENSEVGVITFQKLKFISLEDLPKMVSLCHDVIDLPELVELRLYGLPNFTSIYPDKNKNMSSMQPLFNKKAIIPKLEKLDISMMENLINLFPCNPLQLINHLEVLEVRKCGSIEVLFKIDLECVSGMEEYTSKLRSIKVGDLGKLQELWRITGANNSNILINGFKGVQTIEIHGCKKFTNIFTPATTNFDLHALSTYITRRAGCDVEDSNSKNKLLVKRDQEINVAYPSYLLHTCDRLQHLELNDDKRVKGVVFEMDSPSSRQLATIQQPLLLSYLEHLTLYSLKETSHVWKCNWNKFLIPQSPPLQFPFQNLTYIFLHSCHKLKYLFSPIMVKYLSNLKSVFITDCDGIEEVISSKDDENEESTSTSSHQSTTFFPHLERLWLGTLPCLRSVDDYEISSFHDQSQGAQVIGACWSLCQYPKEIWINNCDALSSLIPWYSLGQMNRLEVLHIARCKTLMEVFQSDSNNNADKGSARGTTITSPTLKNITTFVVPQLSNLKSVTITECDPVQYIFTFSTLESLNQLKSLIVKRCSAIQVIVKEEHETSSNDVVFPHLKTLELDDLPNLKGFFLGLNDFRWPLLDNVMISDCPQMMMFTPGHSYAPRLNYIHTSISKYSLHCGLNFKRTINQTTFPNYSSDPPISKGMPWSFQNLKEISIQHKDVGTTVIPSDALLQLEKLEKIFLARCHRVEEVFEVVALEGNESQTVVKIPNLTQVTLWFLNDLKYLWKSNQWMALEFPNLTTLSIQGCPCLEHVFTCSMVGSLVQLQDLRISVCKSIEVIVKEEEDECDAKANEIMLPRLKSLNLGNLSSLKGFCLGNEAFSLPALETLSIRKCPAITVFTKRHMSTPELKVIYINMGAYYAPGDVNSFIMTNQDEVRTCDSPILF